jgi:hypothetical protein
VQALLRAQPEKAQVILQHAMGAVFRQPVGSIQPLNRHLFALGLETAGAAPPPSQHEEENFGKWFHENFVSIYEHATPMVADLSPANKNLLAHSGPA